MLGINGGTNVYKQRLRSPNNSSYIYYRLRVHIIYTIGNSQSIHSI